MRLNLIKSIILALVLALANASAGAQTALSAEEMQQIERAAQMADNGQAAQALDILRPMSEAHPDDPIVKYELAFALTKDYQFDEAARLFHSLRDDPTVGELAFQMEGNALDMAGRSAEAMQAYREGLRLHPKSGRLIMEIGTMMFQQEDYDEALRYYEMGASLCPTFPSNYYRAAWILFRSGEPWEGLSYAENFIRLEISGQRVEEMSLLTYATYSTLIRESEGDSIMTVAREAGYDPADLEGPSLRVISAVKKLLLYEGCDADDEITTRLFNFERQVMAAGHWDAYVRWLVRKGREEEFNGWLSLHEDMMDRFAIWISAYQDRAAK